jgi:hypothetical protein
MESIERAGEAIFDLRNADEVGMVAHEAVSPDLDGIVQRIFLEPSEIEKVISFLLEDGLLVVPTLGNLMGVAD